MTGAFQWSPGPQRPRLTVQDVHVWRAGLDLSDAELRAGAGLLDEEESARARDCRLPRERARFVAAHAALRTVLARYGDVSPRRLRFARSDRGRPYLRQPFIDGLDFNMSHTAETALIAVALGRRVGVDIEHIDPSVDHMGLARRFLGAEDVEAIRALPAESGRRLFFTRWTWRESHAKAVDGPLSRRLMAVQTDRIPVRVGSWSLWNVPVGPTACATLAVMRDPELPQRVRLYDYLSAETGSFPAVGSGGASE